MAVFVVPQKPINRPRATITPSDIGLLVFKSNIITASTLRIYANLAGEYLPNWSIEMDCLDKIEFVRDMS